MALLLFFLFLWGGGGSLFSLETPLDPGGGGRHYYSKDYYFVLILFYFILGGRSLFWEIRLQGSAGGRLRSPLFKPCKTSFVAYESCRNTSCEHCVCKGGGSARGRGGHIIMIIWEIIVIKLFPIPL